MSDNPNKICTNPNCGCHIIYHLKPCCVWCADVEKHLSQLKEKIERLQNE